MPLTQPYSDKTGQNVDFTKKKKEKKRMVQLKKWKLSWPIWDSVFGYKDSFLGTKCIIFAKLVYIKESLEVPIKKSVNSKQCFISM